MVGILTSLSQFNPLIEVGAVQQNSVVSPLHSRQFASPYQMPHRRWRSSEVSRRFGHSKQAFLMHFWFLEVRLDFFRYEIGQAA
jgi:hypothetical protein